MTALPPFSVYYQDDAYSFASKIMGRQSAGRAFIQGLARRWPDAELAGAGVSRGAARALRERLLAHGYTGQLAWDTLPDLRHVRARGALYYPAPPDRDLAAARNLSGPAAFSLIGVTHTLSSVGAGDQVADLVLPPFQPWDALVCTSHAAHAFVSRLHAEMRDYWRECAGATRFVQVQTPVIPLGVNVPDFTPRPGERAQARAALGLAADATAFLFAGRLSFHAKANPLPVYQALERLAGERPVVCIEAGVHINDAVRNAFLEAQQAIAPSVRFLWVDGQDHAAYRQAWQGADVFVSLSDNIQETFGITPLEAMAAGLPVLVSDWDGYKDTVRDGIDGFRIPTVLPPPGCGAQFALRHALGRDSYDAYVGLTSMATVVEPEALAQAMRCLASDPARRAAMGAAGRARAAQAFDWPVILERYVELARQLDELRRHAGAAQVRPLPQRADPYHRFAHYPSLTLSRHWKVRARPDAAQRLEPLLGLAMTSFAAGRQSFARESLPALLSVLDAHDGHTVDSALAAAGLARPAGVRALMWLWKFDLLTMEQVPRPDAAG